MIHAHPVVSLFCDPNVTLLDRASLCFINFLGHAVGAWQPGNRKTKNFALYIYI